MVANSSTLSKTRVISRLLTGIAVTALASAGILVPAAAAQAAATTYYVNAAAAAGGTGSSAAPFTTITACAQVAVAGDTCLIATGTYRETVVPTNSGTTGAPISFTAAAGAQVTVTGANVVSGWTLDSGSIYSAAVQLSAGTNNSGYSSTQNPGNADLWANQVLVNGTPVPEAQYPEPGTDIATPTSTKITSISGSTITDPALPDFGSLVGANAYFTGGWVAVSGDITANDPAAHSFTFSAPVDGYVYPGTGTGMSNNKNFRITGKKSLLTQAGEWFYDPAASKLYLWAPAGGVPTGVEAKVRNYSFDLQGRHDITVSGISTIASTVRTDSSSSFITLDGLNARYLSQWQTAQYDSSVPYNGIYDLNHKRDSGIILAGHDNVIRNSRIDFSMGNAIAVDGYNMTVQNDLITNISYGGTYTSAVSIRGGSHDIGIVQNTMNGAGRDMINMNTNIVAEQTYKNITISRNDISNYARLAEDLGGVYTCCNVDLAGSRFDHNWIHDPARAGNGFHLDNGSFNVASIDHNVIWGLKGGSGIAQGGTDGANADDLKGNITNNTISTPNAPAITTYYAKSSADANQIVRNNILDSAGGGRDLTGNGNLVTQFAYNQVGPDPQYVNAAAGNFLLQPGSPAITGGVTVAGITTSAAGSVQIGAYEGGGFTPGCTLTGCTQPITAPTVPLVGHTYTITARHSSKLIDGASSQASGPSSPLVQNAASSGTSQRWRVVTAGTSTFALVQQQTGLCATVPGGSTSQGTGLVLSACNSAASQQFSATALTNGYNGVSIVSAVNGLCLDIAGATTSNNGALIQWGCSGSVNQQFQLNDSVLDATVSLQALVSGKYADVAGTTSSQVAQRAATWDASQAWSLVRQSDGYYRLASVGNGQCLSLSSSTGNIVYATCSTSRDQRWSLVAATNSTSYQITSASNRRCIDVPGGNTADGVVLVQYDCNGGANQRWSIVPSPVTVDDAAVGTTQMSYVYDGFWGHATGEAGPYAGTNAYSNAINENIRFTFVGSKISYIAVKSPRHGIVAVSIDGGAETLVDLYAATRAGNQSVWTSALLTPGSHTVKVRVTGTANSAATGTYGVLDAFTVTP